MALHRVDILVVGASGFTGVQVCKHIARSIGKGTWAGVTWGIAGRSRTRLDDKVVTPLLDEGLAAPPDERIVVVDNFDAAGLREAVGRARLCLNCTGPYRFLGEAVVSACIDTGTDYIDLCGEPEFMQRMTLKYHETAADKGVLIIHACAFVSVSADLGCIFAAKQFQPPAVCSSVSSFMTLHTGPAGFVAHATTYESAVHGFGSVQELKKLRNDIKEKFPPVEIPRVGARPEGKVRPFYERTAGINAYCFRFPGADASVVRSTQDSLARRGETSLDMIFVAKGYSSGGATASIPESAAGAATQGNSTPPAAEPDMTIVTKLKSPEPGYVATPIIFIAVTRCLLEERSQLPVSGGVHTPGSVFVNSTLIDRLGQEGMTFEVMEKKGADSVDSEENA